MWQIASSSVRKFSVVLAPKGCSRNYPRGGDAGTLLSCGGRVFCWQLTCPKGGGWELTCPGGQGVFDPQWGRVNESTYVSRGSGGGLWLHVCPGGGGVWKKNWRTPQDNFWNSPHRRRAPNDPGTLKRQNAEKLKRKLGTPSQSRHLTTEHELL